MRRRRACLLIVLISIFLGANALGQNNVGRIISLDGTARLRHVKGNVEILTKKDYARSLQPNQKLRLDRNGKMEILLCDGNRRTIISEAWYTVSPTVICSRPDSPMQRVIDQNFKAFARHRGRKSFILFPIDSKEVTDVIRPETAVFRWASSAKTTLTLSVRVIGTEAMLWKRSNVSVEAGYFADNDLKDVLRSVREQHPDAKLLLNIETTANTNNKVFFQLLPKESEQALQQELANQKEDNELLSHLFRAEIYLRYKLFTEAAEEYEKALKLCPESLELLRATAFIEKEAGNLTRSDELEDYIEKLSKG